MSEIVTPAPTSRSLSTDTGRIGRGGSATDTPHEQATFGQSSEPQAPEAAPSSGPRSDPAVILSSTLSQLQPGQRFAGEIIGQLPDGRFVLESGRGTFVLDLKTSLALGLLAQKTSILLQVVSVGDDIEAAIVSINDTHIHPPKPVSLTLSDLRRATLPPEVARAVEAQPPAARTVATTAFETEAARAAPARPVTPAPANPVPAPLSPAKGAPPQTSVTEAKAPTPPPAATRPSPVGSILTVERADASTAAQLTAGTQLKLTVVAVAQEQQKAAQPGASVSATAVQATAQQATPPAPSSGLVQAATPAAINPSPTGPASSIPPIRTGVTLQATVVSDPAPTPVPTSAALPAATPRAVEAGTLLKTPLGLLRVTDGPKLPDGTQVTVQISDVRVPSPPVRPARPPFDQQAIAAADLTRHWDSLNQALKTIDFQPPPEMLGHVLVPAFAATKAASAPPTSMVQFLLAALRLGDVKSWLGPDVVNRLNQSQGAALLGKISADFANLTRAGHDGNGSEWRPFVLPVHDGSGIQPVAWFVRRPYEQTDSGSSGGGTAGDRPDEGTRFVLELDHKSLGEMQLEGLVHGKRFDLVVRSHQALSNTIRQDITGLFRNIVDRSGVVGEVMFHPSRKFPLSLRADMAHRAFESRPHPERI